MEKTEPKNTNSEQLGVVEEKTKKKKRKPTIQELKKAMGLDSPVIEPPIKIKKDGKHLYQVAGFNYPLRPETLERLNIPNQRILYEVDREKWVEEMKKNKDKQGKTPTSKDDWLD